MPGETRESEPTLPPTEPAVVASCRTAVAVPGYEILGELGEGGMGVVFQARQVSLNRVVALKMILAGGRVDAAARERFRTEAEAIARVHHPGIVQVYEIGEVDGLPFFSLEYCPGGNLADALAGTPLPAQQAAALVADLADAMEAAHRAGVVHRDLKPANVLFAAAGPGSREPKITDFGLAKLTGGGDSKTRTGAVLGTPSYMAPEQAEESKAVGPAADVYALGAILYECLTGRPPFKATTPLDTLMQVVAEEPVPVRRLQPAVPRDLETICLKCLEKTPARRYPSAGALAADLRHFLAGEPVAARPAGWVERAWKWARRRPAAALALAVGVLALAALTAGGLWYQDQLRRHNEELQAAVLEADRASERAKRERQRAQDHLYKALDAVDRMVRVSTDAADPSPEVEEQGRKLQELALALFRDFLQQEGDDPRVRRETARAYFRTAGLFLLLNKNAEAADACRKAIALQTRLVEEFPHEPDYRHELSQSHGYLGHVLTVRGDYAQGYTAYQASRQEGERIVRDHPDRVDYLADLTESLTNLGYFQAHLSAARAEELFRRAVKFGERAVRRAPDAADAACYLATAYHGLGEVLLDRKRLDEAAAAVKSGQDLLEPAGRPAPTAGQEYRHALASIRLLAGQVALRAGRPAEAETRARQAVAVLEALARRHPLFLPTRIQLEPAYSTLGSACWIVGKEKEADAAWHKAEEHGRRTAQDFPTFRRPVGRRDRLLVDVLIDCVRAGKDVPRVVAAADTLAAKKDLSGLILYDVACVYALAAAKEGKYADRALDVLRRPEVIDELRSNARLLRHARETDRDLDVLRGRSDFRAWLAGLERTDKSP